MLIIDENGNVQQVDDPPGRYDLPEWQEYKQFYDEMIANGRSCKENRYDHNNHPTESQHTLCIN
jgi:hypothetical protein